jgi:hypothetical protein
MFLLKRVKIIVPFFERNKIYYLNALETAEYITETIAIIPTI